jgi:hypothetical protein
MTPPGRCHPPMSRALAPCNRRTCVNRATSSVRPTGAGEARILKLNRERPHFRRFAALGSLPVQRVSATMPPDAIDDACCHRARRRQGCPAYARRLRRP